MPGTGILRPGFNSYFLFAVTRALFPGAHTIYVRTGTSNSYRGGTVLIAFPWFPAAGFQASG